MLVIVEKEISIIPHRIPITVFVGYNICLHIQESTIVDNVSFVLI